MNDTNNKSRYKHINIVKKCDKYNKNDKYFFLKEKRNLK